MFYPIRYKKNPPSMGGMNRSRGRKIMDEVTGFFTYEQWTTINDFGERIDARNMLGADIDVRDEQIARV